MLTVTFQFNTPAEAIDALNRLTVQGANAISFADRPDVGAPLVVPPSAAQVFGGAGVPLPPPAPSTAAVVPLPTAPVAPTPGLPTPPPAAAVPSVPSPAATVAAPTAPVAPTSPAGGVEVDADGLPWDHRIHASGEGGKRPKNADGRWRQKRGLNDAALKKRVEDELRAAMAAPGAAVPATPAGQPSPASSVVVPTPPPVAALIAPSAPPTPPAPPAAPAADTFATLMARLGPPMTQGKITMEAVCALMAPFGLNAPAQLAARPDLVPMVASVIDAELARLG